MHWSVLYLHDYHLEGPLGPQRKATERGQGRGEDRGMMGGRCEAGTIDHGSNYKGEIWPDKQYCALQMSIGRGISVAVILSGGDGGGKGGRQRRERQMERCGDCDMRLCGFTHTSQSHGWKKMRSVQLNCNAVYDTEGSQVIASLFVVGQCVCVFVLP